MKQKMTISAPLDGKSPLLRAKTPHLDETMEEVATPLGGAAPSGALRPVATRNDRNDHVSAPLDAPPHDGLNWLRSLAVDVAALLSGGVWSMR